MKNLFLILVVIASLQVKAQENQKIELFFVSLEEGKANPLEDKKVISPTENIKWGHDIAIYPETEFQTIEGIGGAFNEIGGEALLSLDKAKQKEVLDNLFSINNAGFTFCRTAIGASDFGIDAYSYSDVAEDYKMKHFSIKRDEKFVLPYIKGALKVNPDLIIFGSPWSPPAWMKINNSMIGLTEKPNMFRDEDKVYQAYANYFVKYVKAYKKNGITIDRIAVQNENDANTKYPSCTMPPAQMLKFATNYMIPAFKNNNIETKVFAGTFRTALKLDLIDFLKLENANQIEGVGLQYTNPFIISDALKMNPNLKMFHTEGHCYNGENSAEQANHRLEEVAEYINSGLTNFCYWNMILNETTESGWEWPQNSLININRTNKTVQYNPDYNAMYIISKFIKPGDIRIAAISKKPMITVKSPDGKIKILIQNTDKKDSPYRLKIQDKVKEFMVPANGITAIVIN